MLLRRDKKVKIEKGKGKNIGEGDEWENGKKRRKTGGKLVDAGIK